MKMKPVKTKTPPAKPKTSPARAVAFKLLNQLEATQLHADLLLRAKSVSRLAPADQNLATTLVMGCLRWQILLDARIRPLLKKPNARLDLEVMTALRLGAFQLLFLDRIPARAAIDESVELTKSAGHRFASGMVNAVLRKLAAQPKPDTNALIEKAETLQELATAAGHPLWLVARWAASYGLGTARAIVRHGQQPSINALRIADSTTLSQLLAAGIELADGQLLTSARRLISGDLTNQPAFAEGRVRIQDEASQLIAELAAAAIELRQGHEKILDACAAPGGKTLILHERFPAASILACEISEPRAKALAERLAAFSAQIEVRNADVAALPPNQEFALALVDAPCSGTGTLGRNPEIRHRLTEEEFVKQSVRQEAILRTTLKALQPEGRLIYSTCSLEPEENFLLIEKLQAEGLLRVLQIGPLLEKLKKHGQLTETGFARITESLRPDGTLQLMPEANSHDGFFVALLAHPHASAL